MVILRGMLFLLQVLNNSKVVVGLEILISVFYNLVPQHTKQGLGLVKVVFECFLFCFVFIFLIG